MIASLTASLLSLVLVFVLLGSSFAIGSWMLGRIHGEWDPADRLLFSIPLGCGALATVILILGVIGFLHVIVLWGAVFAMGAVASREFGHLRPALRGAVAALQGWSRLSAWLLHITLAAVVLLVLLGALPPVTDWDSLMYHLEIPREFLQSGRILVPRDNLHVAFVGLWHMLYLPLLAAGAAAGPSLLNAAIAVLLGFAVLVAGDRLFGQATGAIAFILLWGTAAIVLVSATPRIDVTLAFYLLLAHYAVLRAAEERRTHGLIVTALLAGMAVGMKYHALLYLTTLLPVAIWAVFRVSQRKPDRLRLIAACLGLTAVVALPWILKNWVLLGAPLYPLFVERVLPPWIAELAGSTRVPTSVAPETFQVLAQARDPVSVWALLFDPASLTVEAEARAFTTTPAIFLLPVALLFLRARKIIMLIVPAVGYLLLLAAASEFINLRYLIPAVPVMMIVIAETIVRAGTRVFDERSWRDILLLTAVLSLFPAARSIREELVTAPRMAAAVGALSDSDYLARSGVPGFAAYYAATRWLGSHVRPDARVLLLFEGRGFYFEQAAVQDNDLTNWPFLHATGASRRCLQDSGITHVLVNYGAAAYYRRRGSDLRQLRWDAFPAFAAQCLDAVHAQGNYELFRVRSGRNGLARRTAAHWQGTAE